MEETLRRVLRVIALLPMFVVVALCLVLIAGFSWLFDPDSKPMPRDWFV